MGELIKIDFKKPHAKSSARHQRRERSRLTSIAAARDGSKKAQGATFHIDRAELDTILMEANLIKSVSGRNATAEQIASNRDLDVDDVKYALALIKVECDEALGAMHRIVGYWLQPYPDY